MRKGFSSNRTKVKFLNIIDLDCVLTEITSGSINNFLPY